MTQASAPQDGILVGDASLAPYDADEWGLIWSKINGFGSRANYGSILGYDNGTNYSLEVTATNPATSNVEVKIGAALVTGTLYWTDATETLAVAANASGNARIDTVILRKDYVLQTIRLIVLQGTPAASPVSPTLTQSAGSSWEIPLADIAVANGFTTIAQTDITPRAIAVNTAPAVYLDGILNNSGADLNTGDVVIWDTSTNQAVTTTTTLNNYLVAGVWVGKTATGSRGRLQVGGVGLVRVNSTGGAIGRNCPIVTYTTAKQGISPFTSISTRRSWWQVGKTLESISTNSLVLALCVIDIRPPQDEAYILLVDSKASASAGGGFTAGTQTRTLNTELFDTDDICSLSANQFTLPTGKYRVDASAPAHAVNLHQLAVGLVSGSGSATARGENAYAPTGVQTSARYRGILIVTSATAVFSLQHTGQTTKNTDGFGLATSFGGEIYATIEIWRINDDHSS